MNDGNRVKARISRADREGAQRYTQLVAGTPLDDRGEVELEAFARLSTRELDALVADLVADESEPSTPPSAPGSMRRFLRGELGFAAALLAAFALIAVLVVGAAAFSNSGVVATTTPPGQTSGSTTSGSTTSGHSASGTSLRPGVITDSYGSDW